MTTTLPIVSLVQVPTNAPKHVEAPGVVPDPELPEEPEPAAEFDERLPVIVPLAEPSVTEFAENVPLTAPDEVIEPFRIAVVSTGLFPSFPVIAKLALLAPAVSVALPVQETTTPTLQPVTLPPASIVKLPV